MSPFKWGQVQAGPETWIGWKEGETEWTVWGLGMLPVLQEGVVGWGNPSQRGRESKSHPAGEWAHSRNRNLPNELEERKRGFPWSRLGRKSGLMGNGAQSWGAFTQGSSYAALTLWGLRDFLPPYFSIHLLHPTLCIWLPVSVRLVSTPL